VQNNNNTVTEYPKGHVRPAKTLTEPPAGPGGLGTGICVTVGTDGTVYAVDHYAGQVYEFANGSTTPTTTLYVNEEYVFEPGAPKPYRAIDTAPNPPYQFAFDRDERYLYFISGTPAEAYVYNYKTAAVAWTVAQGLPGASGYAMSVAVRPAPQP
jgi:hypothetical protein